MEEDYGITRQSLATAMTSHVKGWLCESGDRVVGFSMGDRANGEVQVVAVHPDFESQGIGKTLLAHVTRWLFSQGHDEVWLYANPDPGVRATGFYRKLGWRRDGTRRDDDAGCCGWPGRTIRPGVRV